jgi:hypothetical protein
MQDQDQTFEAWITQNSPRKQLMILQFGGQYITDSQGYETSILQWLKCLFLILKNTLIAKVFPLGMLNESPDLM